MNLTNKLKRTYSDYSELNFKDFKFQAKKLRLTLKK